MTSAECGPAAAAGSLRIVIVDDEPLARDLLRRHVGRRRDLTLAGEAATGREGARLIEREAPDVVLLDIRMPEGDGFDLLGALEKAGRRMPMVVFVTAYDRYAVRAFEMNAVDYLLKPVTRERFGEAMDRCRSGAWRSVERIGDLLEDTLHRAPRRILVRHQRKIVPIPVDSIDYFQAADDYVKLHAEGREHLVEKTLREMELLLAERGFARVHRSLLVNIKRVRELVALGSSRYEAVLIDGTRLPVSRSYSAALRGRLL